MAVEGSSNKEEVFVNPYSKKQKAGLNRNKDSKMDNHMRIHNDLPKGLEPMHWKEGSAERIEKDDRLLIEY